MKLQDCGKRKYASASYTHFNEGVEHYASALYEIDQAYRRSIYFCRRSNQNRILQQLEEKIEKVYANDWLLSFNNNWQKVINELTNWPSFESTSRQRFFKQHVRPFTEKKNRLFVIITDALRYECGVELTRRLLAENRYESSLSYMVASLPSYTQLGLASLLPHQTIAFQEGTDGIVIDGMASAGIQGRSKILSVNAGVRATAVKAEDFMKMNAGKEGRDFTKQYDLIYIYHNRIDKAGDDKDSEEKVLEAVEAELDFLMNLLKKIANVNGTNMMITSDHGFIYQHQQWRDRPGGLLGHCRL